VTLNDDHDGLVAAALRERSRDGEPPMALTADTVLAAARRRTRYRRVLGAAAAVAVLATGSGLAAQLTHHGSGSDHLAAGGTPTSPAATSPATPTPAPTSPGAPRPPFARNGSGLEWDPTRTPTATERQAISRYEAAFAQRLPGLAHGLTPVRGNYFKTGTLDPYTFVLQGHDIEFGKVWLRSGSGTGLVSVLIGATDYGVPTDCGTNAVWEGQTCAAGTSVRGDQVVTLTGTQGRDVLVYLTKPDGTRMMLVSSANIYDGKAPDVTEGALPHPPLTAAELVTLADAPGFTAHP
jgi:hypothetical protein